MTNETSGGYDTGSSDSSSLNEEFKLSQINKERASLDESDELNSIKSYFKSSKQIEIPNRVEQPAETKTEDSVCDESGFSENSFEPRSSLNSLSLSSSCNKIIKRMRSDSNGYHTTSESYSSQEDKAVLFTVETQDDVVENSEAKSSQIEEIEEIDDKKENEGKKVQDEAEEKTENLINASENAKDAELKKKRENLLRRKILELPISIALKNFLLYNRDI